MSDDLSRKGPEDKRFINISQSHEVEYWCKEFNCKREDLERAVNRVGVSATEVEKYLKNKK